MRRGATIKKLLKIFLFIFSIIFTIKIFLKNTLYVLGSQNKEIRRQERKTKKKTQKKQQIFKIKLRKDKFRMFGPYSKPISAVPALFKANFDHFD